MMRRRGRRLPKARGDFDAATLGEALARPGMDPRVWVSYGVVDAKRETPDGEVLSPVVFDEDFGPLVSVTLQPSGTPVRCRVAMSSSDGVGNGESAYHPFITGDEVIVLVPGGSEDGDCAIIGRFNNAIDKFPASSVAGQDPKGNKFAFDRRRVPYVQEIQGAWMTRSSPSGAFLLMNAAGNLTFRDGAGGAMQLTPDLFGYSEPPDSSGNTKALFQYDLTGRRIILQMDSAQLQINSEDADANAGQTYLSVPGDLFVALGTNQPAEHVATIEAVVALLETVLASFAGTPVPGPAIGVAALAALNAALAAGGAPLATTAATLAAGLPIAAARPKPPPVGGVQVAPGLGAVFFKTG